jgi:hypothetical protein
MSGTQSSARIGAGGDDANAKHATGKLAMRRADVVRFTAVQLDGGGVAEHVLNALLSLLRVRDVAGSRVDVRNLRAALCDAFARGDRDGDLGFRLAGAQTLPCAEGTRAARDQTSVAVGGPCHQRTQRGTRHASRCSGGAVERSPGLRTPGGWVQ